MERVRARGEGDREWNTRGILRIIWGTKRMHQVSVDFEQNRQGPDCGLYFIRRAARHAGKPPHGQKVSSYVDCIKKQRGAFRMFLSTTPPCWSVKRWCRGRQPLFLLKSQFWTTIITILSESQNLTEAIRSKPKQPFKHYCCHTRCRPTLRIGYGFGY